MPDPLKILIVDDSRLFRSALEGALTDRGDIRVVGSVFSGEKALEVIRTTPPDLVTLDVEMPGIGGLETLRQIQAFNDANPSMRPVGVIMVSAFTTRGAQVTIEALQSGAFDFVTKPSGESPEANVALLRDQLLTRIGVFRAARRPAPDVRPTMAAPTRATAKRSAIRAIVIGASTGGPKALSQLMPELCSSTDLPILIVQHMPAGFTKSLAESLARKTGRVVTEAVDSAPVSRGAVFVAPGGRHLVLRGTTAEGSVAINDQPAENGCRPSVDVLFRSAATVLNGEVLAMILTGMGRDGAAGAGAIRRAGGHVVAQDEASSVVWGMPGSAVEVGAVDDVVPLNQMARAVAQVLAKHPAG